MNVKAVIFDLDGTLLNSLEDIGEAANSALSRHGYATHPIDDYRYFVGDGLQTLVERIVPEEKRGVGEVEALIATFKDLYQDGWHRKSYLYEGVGEMVVRLQKAGVALTVFSNKPDAFTRLCVKHFFPLEPFVHVQGQCAAIPKKPDPAGALAIADKLGLPVEQIVFVGDSGIDIRTGKGADMTTIGVEWGFRGKKELEANGADHLVKAPWEIVDLLAGGC